MANSPLRGSLFALVLFFVSAATAPLPGDEVQYNLTSVGDPLHPANQSFEKSVVAAVRERAWDFATNDTDSKLLVVEDQSDLVEMTNDSRRRRREIGSIVTFLSAVSALSFMALILFRGYHSNQVRCVESSANPMPSGKWEKRDWDARYTYASKSKGFPDLFPYKKPKFANRSPLDSLQHEKLLARGRDSSPGERFPDVVTYTWPELDCEPPPPRVPPKLVAQSKA